MASVSTPIQVFEEIADLMASRPEPETLLAFRPSLAVRERASELLEKNRRDELTDDEKEELDEFTQAELLMQLVKARVRMNLSE